VSIIYKVDGNSMGDNGVFDLMEGLKEESTLIFLNLGIKLLNK